MTYRNVINNPRKFVVTEDHMKLLKRIWFRYDAYTEFGAPEVDPKRPYGNSDVYYDIAEILGLEVGKDEWGDVEYTPEQIDYMAKTHQEMTTVLQILAANAAEGVSPGVYQKSTPYGIDWKRV